VENTKTLSKRKGQTSRQPLVQDAHQLSVIHPEKQYSIEDAFQVAIILLECIAFEILSGDKLSLAVGHAQKYRPDNIPEEDYNGLLERLLDRMQTIRKRNVISGMF
jgi:hypothetical protein